MSEGSKMVVTAADKPLSEQVVTRIAAMVVAAPILCCGVGFVVLRLLQHRQAALMARYAAMHLSPWPQAVGYDGHPSSFLHGAGPLTDILVRNPAQWGMDIGMAGFALTPLLVIAAGFVAFGLATKRWAVAMGPLLPVAGLLWFWSGSLPMLVRGHTLLLDGAHDALLENGRTVAALSKLDHFAVMVLRHPKGGVDYVLLAARRDGSTTGGLEGPDVEADIEGAGPPLTAMLDRLTPGPQAEKRAAE